MRTPPRASGARLAAWRTCSLLALGALACRPSALPPASPTLAGLELPLAPAVSLRLVVDGQVGDVPAVVELDPGAPVSFLTPGCGVDPLLRTPVQVANPFGGLDALTMVEVAELRLGGVPVPPFGAGLVEGAGCRVTLGQAALGPLALEVHLAARTVRLVPSRPLAESLAALPPGDEVQVVKVAREPRYDWPLVTVRVGQGAARWEGPLLFSAREPWTRLFEAPVRAAGLRPRQELLAGLALPSELALPEALPRFQGLAVDEVALAPGVAVADLALELEAGAPPRLPQGVLGADVWGRFDALLDLPRDVLVLHRPRLEGTSRCARGGATTAEGCVQLLTRPGPGGVWVGAVVWRPLPEGARLTLEPVGVDAPCRVGLSFPPTDRGRAAWHTLPWTRLREAQPACARALARATDFVPATFDEGSLPGCPGECAFSQELATGLLSCECQPLRRAEDEASARWLREQARRLGSARRPPVEPEPADP